MKELKILVLVMLMAGTAIAGIHTNRPFGPLYLWAPFDEPAWIENGSGSPFTFDGYTIESVSVALGDCIGIFDHTMADWLGFPPSIGLTASEALSWTEMSTTQNNYSEVTMDKGATLQPWATIDLGVTMSGLNMQNGTFTYVDSTQPVGQTSFEGEILPLSAEPGTMALLGLGALVMSRRRRQVA